MYLAIVNGRQKDISILSIVARRGTLEEKLTGGTRAIGLPLRTVMEEDISFLDAIRMVLEKQNFLYRHSDMGTMEIYAIMHKNYGYKPYETCFPLHLTFQPVALVGKNGEKAKSCGIATEPPQPIQYLHYGRRRYRSTQVLLRISGQKYPEGNPRSTSSHHAQSDHDRNPESRYQDRGIAVDSAMSESSETR
jgi:hypothetical protein